MSQPDATASRRTVSRGRANGVALAPSRSEAQVMETMTISLTLTEEEAHGLRGIAYGKEVEK